MSIDSSVSIIEIPPACESERPSARPRAGQWLILIALLALATGLRVYGIDARSQWLDEFWSVYLSTGRGNSILNLPSGVIFDPPPRSGLAGAPSWLHVWTGMDSVTCPPLYQIFLRWWMDIFGEGDSATRGLSVVFGVAGMIVLFDAVRRMAGVNAGLAAAAALGLAISDIDLGQEARGYTLLALCGLLACHAIARIEQQIERNGSVSAGGASPSVPSLLTLAQLGGSVLAALLTHYFAAGMIVGLAGYVSWRFRGAVRNRAVGAMAIAILLFVIAWGPWLWRQRAGLSASAQQSWAAEESNDRLEPIWHMARLPALQVFGKSQLLMQGVIAGLVFLMPLPLARRNPRMLIWWFTVAGSIGSIAIFDLAHHARLLTFPRYTFIATPAICALLVAPLPGRRWTRWILPAVMTGGIAMAAVGRVQEGPPAKDDWRGIVRQLDRVAGPNDLLIFYPRAFLASPGYDYVGFVHYLSESHRPVLFLRGMAGGDGLRQIARYPRVWLIGENPIRDGGQLLPGWAPAPGLESGSKRPVVGGYQRMIRSE